MAFYFLITIVGFVLGRMAAGWAAHMLVGMNCGGLRKCQFCERAVPAVKRWLSLTPAKCECGKSSGWWPLLSAVGHSALWILFAWLLVDSPNCQGVHEVRPDSRLLATRLPFHLALIFLLWVALLTDLLDYVIPDEVVYLGILIAIAGAVWSGELQTIHIWVNWDDAIVSVNGPYLPEWMKQHHHLHGLAWSIAGLATGASITWLIRWVSGGILGYPALGLGDVTLMAMIGAFLGWQPTLCILAIAPLTGIVIGLFVRIFSGRSFVAYGPYLVCAAIFVMCTWRWLWADLLELRIIFSHWPSVVGLTAGAFAVLIILLGMLRLFRALPAKKLRR